jgi:hypothetical protein
MLPLSAHGKNYVAASPRAVLARDAGGFAAGGVNRDNEALNGRLSGRPFSCFRADFALTAIAVFGRGTRLAKSRLHRKIPLVRGVYARLDAARLERDEAAAQRSRISADLEQTTRERDGLGVEIRSLRTKLDETLQDRDRVAAQRDRLRFALSRPLLTDPDSASLPDTPTGETQNPNSAADDAKIIERIRAAYTLALAAQPPRTSSFWEQSFYDLKHDIHEALSEGDPSKAREILRDPRKSDLLFGFEILARTIMHWPGGGLPVYLELALLAQAIGARRLWNPEYLGANPDYVETYPDVEALLKAIDDRIGFCVTFPNPFPGEKGLPTSRGLANIRAVQALYQAWLIAGLVPRKDSAVLEIGAGSGRTAFYASQLGMTNYTIIDIPMTNVAQANFLARTLGEDRVALYGEREGRSRIRILPPTAFFGSDDKYDLAINVDSLTEMALDTARSYCSEIKTRAKIFLSINHEYNDFTVREVCDETGFPKGSRHPYWLRRGYLEERFSL